MKVAKLCLKEVFVSWRLLTYSKNSIKAKILTLLLKNGSLPVIKVKYLLLTGFLKSKCNLRF